MTAIVLPAVAPNSFYSSGPSGDFSAWSGSIDVTTGLGISSSGDAGSYVKLTGSSKVGPGNQYAIFGQTRTNEQGNGGYVAANIVREAGNGIAITNLMSSNSPARFAMGVSLEFEQSGNGDLLSVFRIYWPTDSMTELQETGNPSQWYSRKQVSKWTGTGTPTTNPAATGTAYMEIAITSYGIYARVDNHYVGIHESSLSSLRTKGVQYKSTYALNGQQTFYGVFTKQAYGGTHKTVAKSLKISQHIPNQLTKSMISNKQNLRVFDSSLSADNAIWSPNPDPNPEIYGIQVNNALSCSGGKVVLSQSGIFPILTSNLMGSRANFLNYTTLFYLRATGSFVGEQIVLVTDLSAYKFAFNFNGSGINQEIYDAKSGYTWSSLYGPLIAADAWVAVIATQYPSTLSWQNSNMQYTFATTTDPLGQVGWTTIYGPFAVQGSRLEGFQYGQINVRTSTVHLTAIVLPNSEAPTQPVLGTYSALQTEIGPTGEWSTGVGGTWNTNSIPGPLGSSGVNRPDAERVAIGRIYNGTFTYGDSRI